LFSGWVTAVAGYISSFCRGAVVDSHRRELQLLFIALITPPSSTSSLLVFIMPRRERESRRHFLEAFMIERTLLNITRSVDDDDCNIELRILSV
jgi:hypothetical protein